jgi:hypothetical protein
VKDYRMMMPYRISPPVHPELVEGLFFSFLSFEKKKQGFDKLSPNGAG